MIGKFSFWPFGYEAVSRRELTGRMDFGTGPLGLLGNVIWFLLFGWWLAIGQLGAGLLRFDHRYSLWDSAPQAGADRPGPDRTAGGSNAALSLDQSEP